MKPKLIFVLIALFLPTLVFAQEWMLNEKMDDLLIRIKQVQKGNPGAERQVQRLLGEWNTDMRSPMAMRELSRLLRQDAPEELLRHQLPLLMERYGRDHREQRTELLSSLPVTTADNHPLAPEQRGVIAQVLEDFQVNENVGGCAQCFPAIAVDGSGNFVVVWEDYRNGTSDIYIQRYTSSGLKQGANFRVNDESSSRKEDPAIAVDAAGNFMVVWMDCRNGGQDPDIYAQRYSSSGEAQGANFQVNNEDSRYLMTFEPAIAADAEGNFVVVWQHVWYYPGACGSAANIYGQRYNSSGEAQGANFRVNDGLSGSQSYPAIAVDGGGNFVVVWKDEGDGMNPHGIYAQRYTSSGAKQGANFRVNDDIGFSYKFRPAIAVDAGGNFMVAWVDSRKGNYENCDIYAQRYSSSGIAQGINFQVNEISSSVDNQSGPSVSLDSGGNFLVVWHDYRNGDPDIYAQRYSSNGAKQDANFRVNDDSGSSFQLHPAVSGDISGNVLVVWEDERNLDSDIYAQRYSSGAKQDANFMVNDDSGSSYQYYPAIAVDGGGNFVVVWMDARNGNSDLYGQRYISSGEAQGVNFLVNDASGTDEPVYPVIAVDAGGNFVVVWEDYRNGNSDIYAQRYNSSGVKQGANFRVNDASGEGWQSDPAVAVDGGGNFVVVWKDYRNESGNIYAQRYNSSGIAQGNNFQVNDISGNVYGWSGPSVALDISGNFVVVWEGDSDIYGQCYNSSGVKQASNFRVNDDSGSSGQDCPAIAVDAGGNFVVVWRDSRKGKSDVYDIYGQRYMSSGAKQDANFRVNDDSSSSWQWYPAIAADRSGNIVVVWEDHRNGDPDIYAQLFDSQGQRIGSNYRVNNDTGKKKQMNPDVKLVNGHIYYTWEDTRIEGQGYDIFARVDRFSTSVIPGADRIERVPTKYVLYPNYPNPFNPATTISYALPQPAHVQVQIFDVNGREVKRLVDQACSAGVHSVVWNGTDEADRKVCSGIYICRFSAGEVMLHRKMILVK
jgi:hypothetical protein